MDKNTVPATPAGKGGRATRDRRQKLKKSDAAEAHVVVPDHVAVPLPKSPDQQISVPASINGRDLSNGRP